MSRAVFLAIFTPFAFVALIFGWMLGTPHPSARSVVQPGIQAEQTNPAPTLPAPVAATEPAPAQGADGAEGWQARQAVRVKLSGALDRVESAPCDPEARTAFLNAWADRAGAITDSASSSTGDGSEVWRTSDDTEADARVDRLEKQHWFTQDEVGSYFVQRRMAQFSPLPQANRGALQAAQAAGEARCPNLAGAHSQG